MAVKDKKARFNPFVPPTHFQQQVDWGTRLIPACSQLTLSHRLKTFPRLLKQDHNQMKTLEVQVGSRPVVDTRSKVGKTLRRCQMVAISEKYILTQQITRSIETFSNPACLVKRRTVRMRRRRSISELVLPKGTKSINIFCLLSCFSLLVEML